MKELVIKIPDDMYEDANILIVKDLPELKKIIANGKPLPRRHGDLIDRDKFKSLMGEYFVDTSRLPYDDLTNAEHINLGIENCLNELDEMEPVIEADKSKEFHVYFGEYPATALHTVQEVLTAINNDTDVHTTQLFTVSGDLFSQGYRIFVHPLEGDVFELKLGNNEPYTSKEIRIEHNLAELLYAGGFDTDDTTCVRANSIREID